MAKEDIWQELYESSLDGRGIRSVVDFDEYKSQLGVRAQKWVEYILAEIDEMEEEKRKERWEALVTVPRLMFQTDLEFWFDQRENWYFPTNKPNTHKAIFIEAGYRWFIHLAQKQGYILPDGRVNPELLVSYKSQGAEWTDNYLFPTPNYEEIQAIGKKDEELFPDPEPLRVEVAGAILNFTTWDAAFVVYMDCSHTGKDVRIYDDDDEKYTYTHHWIDLKVPIIERPVGNTSICAAIFTRIPLVTNYLRNREEVVKRKDSTVLFKSSDMLLQENVTLFRKNVTELDWRGRK